MDVEELRAAARAAEPPLDEPELVAPVDPADPFGAFVVAFGVVAEKTAVATVAAFDSTWEKLSGEPCEPGAGARLLFEKLEMAMAQAVAKAFKKPPESDAARLTREAAAIATSTGVTMAEATRTILEMASAVRVTAPKPEPKPLVPFKVEGHAMLICGGVHIATATNVTRSATMMSRLGRSGDGLEFEFTSAEFESLNRVADAVLAGEGGSIAYMGDAFKVDNEWLRKFVDAMADGFPIAFEWYEPDFKTGAG